MQKSYGYLEFSTDGHKKDSYNFQPGINNLSTDQICYPLEISNHTNITK